MRNLTLNEFLGEYRLVPEENVADKLVPLAVVKCSHKAAKSHIAPALLYDAIIFIARSERQTKATCGFLKLWPTTLSAPCDKLRT